ncbi:thiol-disulfide oxidoreductase DCC family protein [Pseudomonas sp. RGM 3321]|uniref:thiol-disulfide oxidoreductase DCC family protein n=1 Tax=Pseudomonas sp. RGM 3321 TaxID=2930089 RepID=UPI001FCB5C39|nr:thiol-disulfide oxidoreductase DCC family protein [Pseudomonas sp. RGM 3321]MCJ2373623.1 thiol-disulfide oxidoreductase DCC family protein [Pseudomonas sp. RGM 3321]
MQSNNIQLEPAPFLKAGETVVLYDGVCKLCGGWAKFIIRHDRERRIRLATVQSPEGQALLEWAGLPLDRFDTMAAVTGNRLYVRSEAFIAVISDFPAPWRWLGVLRLFPAFMRDWCYDRIALNRYRLFGRHDVCLLPSPDHERRFLKAGS